MGIWGTIGGKSAEHERKVGEIRQKNRRSVLPVYVSIIELDTSGF